MAPHARVAAAVLGATLLWTSHAGAETLLGAGTMFTTRSQVPGPVGGEFFAAWHAAFQGFGLQSWYVYLPQDSGLHMVAVQGAMVSPTRGFGVRLRFTVGGGVAASRPSGNDSPTRVQPVASLGTLVKVSEHALIGARSTFFLRPGATKDDARSPRWSGSIVLVWRP